MSMRAVYYARVSTEEERQLNALSKQCDDLVDCINKNGWELVDSYIDEGKSGTTTKKRDEYKRLCEDIENDKFDIIVIKSQDRLMRNVMDWYIFVDKLVTNGKKLYMYMENSFYKTDDALITGIKAILAAEYSRDLSKKLNNAHKRRESLGSTVMTSGTMLGYNQVNGELVINEKEAEIVKRIFKLYLEGYGATTISKILADDGIYNNKGNPFGHSTLIRILKNEKYMGTMICNKTHKDFDTKKIIKNDKSEWYIHENRIPPIISEEDFNRVQELILSKTNNIENDRRRGKRGKKHILSSKMICGECGSSISVFDVKKRNSVISQRGMCLNFAKNGRIGVGMYPEKGCNMPNVDIEKLNKVIEKIIEQISIDEDYLYKILENVKEDDKKENYDSELKSIRNQINNLKQKREMLLDKYLDGIIKEDIYISKSSQMDEEQDTLIKKRNELENQIAMSTNKDNKINTIINIIKQKDFKYDTFIDMIEKILIYRDAIYLYIIGINKPILIEQSVGFGRKHTAESWRSNGNTTQP